MIMPYVESAIAFALVMLAGSLVVNIGVRLYHHWTDERSRGVQDMLGQLHRGFVAEHVAMDRARYRVAQDEFLDAVLSSPILHDCRAMAEFEARHGAGGSAVAGTLAARRKQLWSRIDYISRDDLIAILQGRAARGVLPARWFGGEVDALVFCAYVQRWFQTAEATARQRFSVAARRLSVILAGVVVVLLNLDALRLGYDLYRDRVLCERLANRQVDLADVAQRQASLAPPSLSSKGAAQDDQPQMMADLQKTAAVLTIERVPLGWQDAWISRRWCAYHDACDDPQIARPADGKEMAGDVLMWIFGLAVSWVMLSLGAPFWVDILKWLSNLKNFVQDATAGSTLAPGTVAATTTTTTTSSAVAGPGAVIATGPGAAVIASAPVVDPSPTPPDRDDTPR